MPPLSMMPVGSTADTVSDVEKASRIDELDIPKAAIERFLNSREIRTPAKNDSFVRNVARQLSQDDYDSLIGQYLYAGRQTINYFVVVGISDFEFSEIEENVGARLPTQDAVSEVLKEPFLADSHTTDDRLYLSFGYYEGAGGVDPVTGARDPTTITKRIVAIISESSDLVEIRGSDTTQVDRVLEEACKSIGKYQSSVKRRPNLGTEFQEEFNEEVESYFNLRVLVNDESDEALDTVAFTSAEDGEGNRHDARESKRVKRELAEEGSEITTGYVELSELRFRINREQAKISFTKYEREENLNQVTDFIDEVLRQVGEYSQGQLSGIDDVPE